MIYNRVGSSTTENSIYPIWYSMSNTCICISFRFPILYMDGGDDDVIIDLANL